MILPAVTIHPGLMRQMMDFLRRLMRTGVMEVGGWGGARASIGMPVLAPAEATQERGDASFHRSSCAWADALEERGEAEAGCNIMYTERRARFWEPYPINGGQVGKWQ